ncbi:COG3650 family protein [Vibrio ishigakensis]|nr:hypothetical protein [Vibrio ishigakensis]
MKIQFRATKTWVALSSSLILFGCSQTPTPPAETDTTSADNQALVIDDSAPARILLKGQMIWGHEVRTLQPCGSENAFWVQLPEAFKQPVSNLTSEPYQPMYAEVFGYLEPTAAGFAEQYPAQFVVTEVNMVTAENPNRCEQSTRPDRAFGNEPFWNATYDEQKVTFTQMGQEAQEFTVKELEQDLTQTRVDYNSGSLTIDKQICRDTMSDSLYGTSSSVEVNGKAFKGCSTLSNQADQELFGSYAQTQDDGTTITLTLKPDHTSETRYSYADGSNDVTENGYWQPLTNGKIEATNVSYQGQKLIATREFELEGNQLSTQNETINGNEYPLTGKGLVLDKQ